MICKGCGKVVAKTHKYCPYCGVSLVEKNSALDNEELIEEADSHQDEVLTDENNQTDKKCQGFGIAGFVLGLCGFMSTASFLINLLGIVFSSIALAKFNPEKHKCKGFAVAGLVLSILGIVSFVEYMLTKFWIIY